MEHEIRRRLTKGTKEQSMEYLILVGVVAMIGALRADHHGLPETAGMRNGKPQMRS